MGKNENLGINQLMGYEKVVVPIIQRDFVYGLETESAKKFIGDIFACLYESLTIDFGFIYGYHNEEKTIFHVIDGQQRLTILYLLQQYLSWGVENRPENSKLFKLVYEVRCTTQDFLTELSREKNDDFFLKLKRHEKFSELVKKNTFFQTEWSYDPSIKAMLEMIDIIHNTSSKYLKVNISSLKNVTFQFLSMDDFGLTDDLYIKMNARGKPLTAFENFKAWLEKEVDGNTNLDNKLNVKFKDWKTELDVDWLNIFWRLDNKEPVEHLNKCYLRFFYGNAINKIAESETINGVEKTIGDFISKSSCSSAILAKHENLKKLFNDYSIQYCFEILDFYKETHDHNTTMLNSYYKKSCQLRLFGDTDNDKNIFDDFLNIEKSQKNFISEEHRYRRQIVFYAYTSYIMKLGFDDNLQDWLRVIINLSINSGLNVKSFISSISSVKAIINDPDFSGKIYVYLNNKNQSIFNGFDNYQAREEIEKAKLITNDSRWKDVLHEAEEHDFFQGQIFFLLQLAGYDTEDASEDKLERFINYSKKSKLLFTDKNTSLNGKYILQRGLLLITGYFRWKGLNQIFGYTKEQWRSDFFLKNKKFLFDNLKIFFDSIENSQNFRVSIQNGINKLEWDDLIKNDKWKFYFIKNEKMFSRCEKGFIRSKDGYIYLLTSDCLGESSCGKSELVTYFFYQNYIYRNYAEDDWVALKNLVPSYSNNAGCSHYYSESGTEHRDCFFVDGWIFEQYTIALDVFFKIEDKYRGFCFRFFVRNKKDGKKIIWSNDIDKSEKASILFSIYDELNDDVLCGAKFHQPTEEVPELILQLIPEERFIPVEPSKNIFESIVEKFNDAVQKAKNELIVE